MGYAAEQQETVEIEHGTPYRFLGQENQETSLTVFNPFEIEPADFRKSLDIRTQNRNTMLNWIRENLTEGVDYGRIHTVSKDKCKMGKNCTNPNHFSKPSLFKPGAEKICGLLGLRPEYPAIADYERKAVEGGKIEVIILRCFLYSGDRIVAEGTGSRLVSKDYGDINKSIKMALKSGQIDATLRCGGLSEIFTQDIEDMNLSGDSEAAEKVEEKAKQSELMRLKDKLNEATHLIHLQRIWQKHLSEIRALSETDRNRLIELKDVLKASLAAKAQREQAKQDEAAKPEPEYLITADQIDRIRQIVKPGGLGNGMLTELEIAKLLDCGNNPNSTQADTEILINDAMAVIRQRESEMKSEMEGD